MAHETLEQYLSRDPLSDHDFTKELRVALKANGVEFNGLPWKDTEAIVEAAIKPLRDEIARLRELVRRG